MVNEPEAQSPRDLLQRTDAEWREVATKALGPDATLISVSRYLPDSRVYSADGRVAKIRRRPEGGLEFNDLSHEADLLREMGRDVTYERLDDWEYSVQDEILGSPFSAHLMEQQDTKYTFSQRVKVLRNVMSEIRRLHKSGISHGDLRADNVMLVGDGVVLVDFDLARRTGPLRAAYRDWVGIGRSRGTPYPFWELAVFTLAPRIRTLGLRLRNIFHPYSPKLPSNPSPDLVALDQAWQLARQSPANARGQGLAYYAMTYRGHHFRGERGWYARWDVISSAVDFTGKSVLELGCNMGLLSSFARLNGATDAHGVDHDALIIQAAELVARGLQSNATFEQVDLNGEERWEERLGGRDLVTALSVVHWLPDRDRVLDFLGTHSELIYEGHDTLEIETERLRSLGFDRIDLIGSTERDRHILHARKG
jgi:serine/threonine protein kinase